MNFNVIPHKLINVQQIYWHSFEVYSSSLIELNGKCHNSVANNCRRLIEIVLRNDLREIRHLIGNR